MNSPESAQFERLYSRLWGALRRHDVPDDLSQHELQLLHHLPPLPADGVSLNYLAHHLGLPKSTASATVKDLERRGFLTRARDPRNERQLSIVLTPLGEQRVATDTVLELPRLARALRAVPVAERRALLAALERLALASEQLPLD